MKDYRMMTSAQLRKEQETEDAATIRQLADLAAEYDGLTKAMRGLPDGRFTLEVAVVDHAKDDERHTYAEADVSRADARAVLDRLTAEALTVVDANANERTKMRRRQEKIEKEIQNARQDQYYRNIRIGQALEKARERESQAAAKRTDAAKHVPPRPPRTMAAKLGV